MRAEALAAEPPLARAWTRLAPLARLAAEVAPPLALYVALDAALGSLCRLPESAYAGPSIALPLARALAAQPLVWLAAALLAWRRGPLLWRAWGALEHGRELRWLVGGIALVFAWSYASYDLNLYFDREHLADRALLVALAALGCWRPLFLLGFTPLLLAVVWQFEHPFGGYSWTDKTAPLRVLLWFCASFLWLAASGSRRADGFLFGAGCVVAAHYAVPGLEKLRLGWLGHGDLQHLMLAAWANGWLAGLDAGAIAGLARAFERVEPLLMGFTLASEVGALLFFWRRGLALALLASQVLLHAGIFAVSGICFWKWALLDLGLLALLWRLRASPAPALFGPAPLALSLALIASAPAWCKPVRLGWFDTRLAYTFRYHVVGASGRATRVAPSFFAPYDLSLAQGRFHYLSPEPALVATYGATRSPRIAAALQRARTLEDVQRLEREQGRAAGDPRAAARFDEFMRRFLSARNRRAGRQPGYTALAPPLHIWTAPRAPAPADAEPIAGLVVERVTTLWDGVALRELRVERVRELAIGPRAAGSGG